MMSKFKLFVMVHIKRTDFVLSKENANIVSSNLALEPFNPKKESNR